MKVVINMSRDFKIGVADTYVRLVYLSFSLFPEGMRRDERVKIVESHDSIAYFNGFDTSGFVGKL